MQIPRKDIKKKRVQAKSDPRSFGVIPSEEIVYHDDSRDFIAHHVPAELVRSYSNVPLDLSMSSIHRSTPNGLCTPGPSPMNLSNHDGSALGSPRARPFILHYSQGNSFLGQDANGGGLHRPGSSLAKSQELINRALILVRSNNNIGRST